MKEANRAWSMISHFQVDYFGHIHFISAAPLWHRSVTAITRNDDSAVVSELSGVDIDLCHDPIRVPKNTTKLTQFLVGGSYMAGVCV